MQASPAMVFLLWLAGVLGYLLPNHNAPWRAFHSEALHALVLAVIATTIFVRIKEPCKLPVVAVVAFSVALVPWGQFLLGGISSPGTAWVNSLYLFGFALAISLGFNWERFFRGEGLQFLSVVLMSAAIVSVAMQMTQWFRMDYFDIWVNPPTANRFSANLAQPNQLATLLILGGMSTFFLRQQGKVGGLLATIVVVWLLSGVVLAESRTAWINLGLVFALLGLFWRDQRPVYAGYLLAGLMTYFLIANWLLFPLINDLLFVGQSGAGRQLTDPIRVAIWSLSLQQIISAPIMGWGWGELSEAFLGLDGLPNFQGALSHAHNVALDLLLANGPILGGALVLFGAMHLARLTKLITDQRVLVPLLSCLVLLVHASVELPLHYAYFLLPFGFYLGVIEYYRNAPATCVSKPVLVIAAVVAIGALLVTARDYFIVEQTLHSVRYGQTGKNLAEEREPDLWVLTQWSDRLKFANAPISKNLSDAEYATMRGVVISTPSPFLYFKLARHLTEGGRTDQAKFWLNAICTASPPKYIEDLSAHWQELLRTNVSYTNVSWRGCSKDTPASASMVDAQ